MIKILTRKSWAICFVTLMACGSLAVGPESKADEQPNMQLVMDAPPSAASTGISEVAARELLDRMFRAVDLRVVNDVAWTSEAIEVTLDGYDPEREIGYEYVASAEVGTELDPSELDALDSHPQILLARACSRAELVVAAERFLALLPPVEDLDGDRDPPTEP